MSRNSSIEEHWDKNNHTTEHSSMVGEYEISRDDSGQTVISHSPPLELLAASTIEHHDKGLYEKFSQTGHITHGTQLAHFVVTKYIGGGGMGRVYLGVDQALDRKVAIKVLPVQRSRDQASVARFMNEAKSAARLNHEHIAQVYFAGEHNSIPFIAFEYVQGTNIRTYVEDNGVLPLPQAITYLLQISHALAHAATHQVIHRDVKPSNILITSGGRAKLIDMGLARLLTHAHADNDLTASGVTLGTFDYISPEQARDPRNADARSDIYSLGCTFFFMLTGRPPFSEGTVLQKLLQHQGDEPPDVRDFQPNIPPYISQIIQKMMAKDPKSRYQTASDLVDDLTEAAKMIGLRPVGTSSLIWQLPLKGRLQPVLRHIPWIVPLILFFILVVLIRHGFIFDTLTVTPPLVPNTPTPLPGNTVSPSHGNSEENGNEGNGTPGVMGNHLLTSSPKLQFRELTGEVSSSIMTSGVEHNRNIVGTNSRQKVGAALEVAPVSATSMPVIAASYQAIDSKSLQTEGNSPAIFENLSLKELIVDPSGLTANSFKTLKGAAGAAAREATIELRFTGPLDIEYFRFAGSKVTIKGGENFRPKIVFRPPASVKLTGAYSMATFVNSDILFENIEIEMEIPQSIDAIANRWTMFDLDGMNTVELKNVILTFNNAQSDRAYQEKNAFFRCCPVSGMSPILTTAVSGSPSSAAAPLTRLALHDCLVRGEASLLRCDNSRAAQVESDNVLVATNQPVFSLLDIKPSETPGNLITAIFRHNTIFAPALVSWQQGPGGATIGHSIDLSLYDSIVRFNGDSPAMAVYAGVIAKLSNISGSGFYSRQLSSQTFFQNFTREWVIRPLQSGESPREAPPTELQLEPQQYQKYFDTVIWENPFIDNIPVHSLTKNNFLLDEKSSKNNALKASADKSDAGIKLERIRDPYGSSP